MKTPLVALGVEVDDKIGQVWIVKESIVDDSIDLESPREFSVAVTNFVGIEHSIGFPGMLAPGLVVPGIFKRGDLD